MTKQTYDLKIVQPVTAKMKEQGFSAAALCRVAQRELSTTFSYSHFMAVVSGRRCDPLIIDWLVSRGYGKELLTAQRNYQQSEIKKARATMQDITQSLKRAREVIK